MSRILRCGFSPLIGLMLLADPTAATDPPVCPTVTFTGSEVYLYGHGPYTVNVLSVEGDTVRINGIPVYPKLRKLTPERKVVVDERARAEFALDRQADAVKNEMLARGAPDDQRLKAMMEVYRAAPALVDSVVPESSGEFWIWWHGVTWRDLRSIHPGDAPALDLSPRERMQQYYNEYRGLLERENFLIVTTSTDFNVRMGCTDHVDVARLEIARARAATSPLTYETWPHGCLHEKIAEQFRRPVPIAGLKD